MRLKIRAVQLRVRTATLQCGADLAFNDGLVIIHADNSHGKSTVMQSIIYALGLEGMLSASHDVPLPHVMTDSIDLPDGTKQGVVSSSVAVEVENAEGKVATVFRSVRGENSNHLMRVGIGGFLTKPDPQAELLEYYVRESGAATNQRGFHTWFCQFLGWTLPRVARVDGTECPLYVECIFPLMIIEQKRGWSAIQARMPFHYRIREVAKRSFEFLLGLEVNDLALLRQRLREEAQEIKSDWSAVVERIGATLALVNGVPQGLNRHEPRAIAAAEGISILVARGGQWLPFAEAFRNDQATLKEVERAEIPRVEAISREAEAALTTAREELAQTDFATNEFFRSVQQDEQQLLGLDDRLISLEEDDRRNNDLIKLRRLGSAEQIQAAKGQCPTCHQAVADSLLPLNRQTPMTAEENLKFIRAQIETFSAIKKTSGHALAAKHRRLDSLRLRSVDLRSNIRALQKTLVSDGREPSVAAIERRLKLRENVITFKRVNEQVSQELPGLRELGRRWIDLHDKIAKLPKGDLSTNDKAKLARLSELFVSNVRQFELTSVDPASLRISDDNYRPEHGGFDLEFDLSASDMIRTIWAYLNSLLEISREAKTNHLGLLMLDEPKQQETKRTSFRQLFARVAQAGAAKQQVIVATSEDAPTLKPLLEGIPHQFMSFTDRIIKPLAPLTSTDAAVSESEDDGDSVEMPWEAEARAAVSRAIESFDWNTSARTISFRTHSGEIYEASSYDELYAGLCSVASDAWSSLVPFDGGEPFAECDDGGIVDDLLGNRVDELTSFFAGRK